MEDEDYLLKSPVRQIHKIKTNKTIKETLSDEEFELLRDYCDEIRDLALIDLLASAGKIVTQRYAMVNQANARNSHRKFIS